MLTRNSKRRPGRWAIMTAGFAAAGLLGACATTGRMAANNKVDDSRLAGLSSDQMAPVHEQRQAIEQARNEQSTDEQNKVEADNRLRLARTEHDIAQARLDQAKTAVDLTQKNLQQLVGAGSNGSNAAQTQPMASAEQIAAQQRKVAAANSNARLARSELDAANAKIDYLKSLADVADRQVNYDRKNVDLQQAKLDQTKFQVLEQAKPAEAHAMGGQAPDYTAQVAQRQADVAQSNAALAQARADANSRYHSWVVADWKIGQSGHIQMQSASVPPPPRG